MTRPLTKMQTATLRVIMQQCAGVANLFDIITKMQISDSAARGRLSILEEKGMVACQRRGGSKLLIFCEWHITNHGAATMGLQKKKRGGPRPGAGHPKTIDGGKGGKIISFRLGKSHIGALDRYAASKGLTRSEAMRCVIERIVNG